MSVIMQNCRNNTLFYLALLIGLSYATVFCWKMLVTLLIIVLLCIFVWMYVRWRQVSQYWEERGVPYLPPHPIMGSLTFLQRQNPAIWMIELYNQFKTPYVGMWNFWRPALVINDPELASNILVKDFDYFRNRFLTCGQNDPVGAHSITALNDPMWSNIRHRLARIFTPSKLRSVQGLAMKKSQDLVQRILNDKKKGKPGDLRTFITDYTTDLIGTAALGVETNSVVTGDDALRSITKDWQGYDFFRGLAWSCIFFFPELVDIFRFKLFPSESVEYFRKVFRAAVEERGGYHTEVKEPRDILDALRKIKYDSIQEGQELSEDVVLAQAVIMLLGGFDTSSSALSFCIYLLAFYPDEQEKIYQELTAAKKSTAQEHLDSGSLAKMIHLNCALKETFRMFPPMGWIDRVADKDYTLDDKLTIKAGTPVYINANGFHYDPVYFPEPRKFKPSRFTPENEVDIKPFTYLPFGEGPRMCIGLRFAYISLRHALAEIILNFEVRPLPTSPAPMDVELEKRGLFLMPGEPLIVDFTPRNNKFV